MTVPDIIILDNLRSTRNRALIETDSWMASDRGLSQEQIDELLTYRQALRDFPETVNLQNIVWPQIPEWMI